MAEPLLKVQGLVKRFGGLVATDKVSLDIRHGEVHALIGPNGAGKTTLIAQLSGSLASDAGRLGFDGSDISTLPQHERVRRGLARSYQITSIFKKFSVLDNVALAVQARSGTSMSFWRPLAAETALAGVAPDAVEDGRSGHRGAPRTDLHVLQQTCFYVPAPSTERGRWPRHGCTAAPPRWLHRQPSSPTTSAFGGAHTTRRRRRRRRRLPLPRPSGPSFTGAHLPLQPSPSSARSGILRKEAQAAS